jgi:hypothetical protein
VNQSKFQHSSYAALMIRQRGFVIMLLLGDLTGLREHLTTKSSLSAREPGRERCGEDLSGLERKGITPYDAI